jgi:putative hydrolase of the HAD superfamily
MPNLSKQAVFFDLDGTLRHNDPSQIDTFFSYARDLGVMITPKQAHETTRWIYSYWADSEELRRDRQQHSEEWEAFWRAFAVRQLTFLGATPEEAGRLAEAIQRRMIDEYKPSHCVPKEVPSLLEDLRQAGCRLGVVSNRRNPIGEVVSELGLAEQFDMTLAAGEVGWWKPDHRLLIYAAERLGVPAADAMYVGDNFYADVPAAEGAGMQAVLLDPAALFPEANCRVIQSLGELTTLLAPPSKF